MRRAKKATKAKIQAAAMSLSARLERAELALRKIVYARDYCAERGEYPSPPNGPSPIMCDDIFQQAFDDWAADVAEEALGLPKQKKRRA